MGRAKRLLLLMSLILSPISIASPTAALVLVDEGLPQLPQLEARMHVVALADEVRVDFTTPEGAAFFWAAPGSDLSLGIQFDRTSKVLSFSPSIGGTPSPVFSFDLSSDWLNSDWTGFAFLPEANGLAGGGVGGVLVARPSDGYEEGVPVNGQQYLPPFTFEPWSIVADSSDFTLQPMVGYGFGQEHPIADWEWELYSSTAVPEPSTCLQLGLGCLALTLRSKRAAQRRMKRLRSLNC